MLHGIRKCLLYGNGELRVSQLCFLLKQKAVDIWRYMNTALDAANLYLVLASCVEGKEKDRIVRNLRFIAMENCEKTIKRLKKRKFIKDPLDLESDIRVKYFSTLYYAYFYWKQNKQALQGSLTCLQDFVDQWKDESGEYIYKLQWLLQWHKRYLDME